MTPTQSLAIDTLINRRNRRPLKEIAEYLEISDRTAKRWVQSGKLPAVKIGGRVYSSRPAADTCVTAANDWEQRMKQAVA